MLRNWIKRLLHIESPTYEKLEYTKVQANWNDIQSKYPQVNVIKYKSFQDEVFARPKLIDPKKLLETRFPCAGNDGEDTLVRLRDVITAIEQAPDEVIVECASWVGERGEWTCGNCGESAPLDGYLDSKYCYGCGRIMVNSSKLEEGADERKER